MAQIDPESARLKDSTEVTIRTGVEKDASSLLATLSAYISENEGMVWEPDEYQKSEEDIREWIGDMLESPREILILAETHGVIENMDFAKKAGGRVNSNTLTGLMRMRFLWENSLDIRHSVVDFVPHWRAQP
jgi:hypothetical protein